MGAGDDENGCRPDQGMFFVARKPPVGESNCARCDGHVEKDCSGTVGEILRVRPEAWAAATSRMMPDRAVCSPTAVMRTRRLPPAATVPAMTLPPGPFETVRDSPVIIDSSTSAELSMTCHLPEREFRAGQGQRRSVSTQKLERSESRFRLHVRQCLEGVRRAH